MTGVTVAGLGEPDPGTCTGAPCSRPGDSVNIVFSLVPVPAASGISLMGKLVPAEEVADSV